MKPFEMQPGIVSLPTKNASSGYWQDGNLVRWSGNKLMPIPGWSAIVGSFDSKPRRVLRHTISDGRTYTFYLCRGHLYVDDTDLGITDVSPTPAIEVNTGVDGGWGDGTFGTGTYGTPRDPAERSSDVGNSYSLYSWGDNVLAMTNVDGRLLQWDPPAVGDPMNVFEEVVEAPKGRCFVVTPERHVIIFNPIDNLTCYAWCDKEDLTNWEYADVLSQAGFLPIEPYAKTIGAVRSSQGVYAFNEKVNILITYRGAPYIYGHDALPESPAPLASAAMIDSPVGTVWMAFNGFWAANGLSVAPIPCPLWSWIDENMDLAATKRLAHIVSIPSKSELWFFFSTGGDVTDRCVIWNYKDSWWSKAYLERSAGLGFQDDDKPIMTTDDTPYLHETSNSYADNDGPWLLSQSFSNDSGLLYLPPFKADFTGNVDAVQARPEWTMQRSEEATEYTKSYASRMSNGYMPMHVTGEVIRIRIKSNEPELNGPWSMGKCVLPFQPAGER